MLADCNCRFCRFCTQEHQHQHYLLYMGSAIPFTTMTVPCATSGFGAHIQVPPVTAAQSFSQSISSALQKNGRKVHFADVYKQSLF